MTEWYAQPSNFSHKYSLWVKIQFVQWRGLLIEYSCSVSQCNALQGIIKNFFFVVQAAQCKNYWKLWFAVCHSANSAVAVWHSGVAGGDLVISTLSISVQIVSLDFSFNCKSAVVQQPNANMTENYALQWHSSTMAVWQCSLAGGDSSIWKPGDYSTVAMSCNADISTSMQQGTFMQHSFILRLKTMHCTVQLQVVTAQYGNAGDYSQLCLRPTFPARGTALQNVTRLFCFFPLFWPIWAHNQIIVSFKHCSVSKSSLTPTQVEVWRLAVHKEWKPLLFQFLLSFKVYSLSGEKRSGLIPPNV